MVSVGSPHPRTIILGAVFAVGGFTLVAAIVTLEPLRGEELAVAIGLVAAAILAERFPVVIHGIAAGSTSLATIFLSTLAVISGWQPAVIAGAITMGTVELLRRKRRVAMAYNVGLYVLAAAAAGLVCHEVLPEGARIGLAAPTAFWLVNISLLAAIIAADGGRSFPRVWSSFIAHTSVPFVVMAALTGVLVALYEGKGPWYMLLMAPPLVALAVYQTSTARLLQRRDELDRLKDEVVAVVSHELRTPLASVSGAAMTLQRTDLREDYRERLLAMMGEEAKRLNRLIDEVLWASMSERGLTPKIGPIDAGELARTAAEEAATVAPDGLFIHGSGWGTALGDEAQVRRVLNTLLENSIKYSPEGGEVRVAAAVHNGFVRFTVSDQGIGIPESERERVFEKFHRLDPQMLQGIGGTGLGLYIARRLLERMGGSIWIDPNSAKGTTFVFELPAQGGPPRPPKEVNIVKKIALLLLTVVALFVATASVPSGWKWDKKAHADDTTPSGWSWNSAEVVSTGSGVTLAGDTSTVTVSAPTNADPTVGDSVTVATTTDDTLLGFRTVDGGISWVALGWSWND